MRWFLFLVFLPILACKKSDKVDTERYCIDYTLTKGYALRKQDAWIDKNKFLSKNEVVYVDSIYKLKVRFEGTKLMHTNFSSSLWYSPFNDSNKTIIEAFNEKGERRFYDKGCASQELPCK